jgi:hypothetical protein
MYESSKPFFAVLLTVHLGIFILVINQLDAQNFCFTISFISCLYMFRAHVLPNRSSKLYYAASGVIKPAGGRPVQIPLSTCAPDSHVQSVVIPDAV